MSFHSYFRRTHEWRKARPASHRSAGRRLRFETFEDRCLLSFTPVPSDGWPIWEWVDGAADLNNDGDGDAVILKYWEGQVSVQLSDGQGGFGDVTLYDVGSYPLSVAVGDFNEDGSLDLATANMGDYTYTPSTMPSVGVLLNNGDGTFAPVHEIRSYGNPRSVAVGDFNDDGHLDLGVAASSYGFLGYYGWASVHAGDGNGNFADPESSYVWPATFSLAIAADLNGDGADELLIRNVLAQGYSGDVHIFVVNPLGHLEPSNVLFINHEGPQGISAVVSDVAVGDLNRDGVADVVTANSSGNGYRISVFFGDGEGGYGDAQNYLFNYDASGSIVLGDFNGDGWLDIARGNWVLLNDQNWSTTLPGDYNRDGTVDAADYTIWRDSLGRTGLVPASGADGSGNGIVGPEDYEVWKSHFGQTLSPEVSIDDLVQVTEGNVGTTNASFTVTLSKAATADVIVHYATEDTGVGFNDAVAGSDYVGASGEVVIPAGQTSATFNVAVLGDRRAESAEYFLVRLSDPTNATIGSSISYGLILDDEPYVIINSVSQFEGHKNTTAFNFTVSLSHAYDVAVTANYSTQDGTANAGSDYQAKSGSVTFAPGQTTKTITVLVNGDRQGESDEYFEVDVDLAMDGETRTSVGFGTILDDDGGLNASGNGIHGAEDDDVSKSLFGQTLPLPGAGSDVTVADNAAVVLTASTRALSEDAPLDVPVHYDVATASVTAGSGSKAKSSAVVIMAGQTSRAPVAALSATHDQPKKMSHRTAHGTAKTANRANVVKTGTLASAPGKTTKSVTTDVEAHIKLKSYEAFYRDLIDNHSDFLFTELRGIGTILDEGH